MTRKREVVVGIDGSETSTAAARWAAGEAHARGAKLVLLYSFELYAYGSKDAALPGSIPYEEALGILAKGGYQGVFLSEYEGHAFYLNDADEQIDRHLALGQRILKAL